MATKRSILQSFLHETYGKDHLSDDMIQEFTRLMLRDAITRDEGALEHVCVFFIPYNSETGEIFLSHHKKINQWIAPVGHVEKGEALRDAVIRQWEEALGDEIMFEDVQGPFHLSQRSMKKEKHYPECDHHYELWYFVNTDGENIAVDGEKYHATEWMSVDDAIKKTSDKSNASAFEQLKKHI